MTREVSARQVLYGTPMPVATATLDRHLADPFGAIWLPLRDDRRVRLLDLRTRVRVSDVIGAALIAAVSSVVGSVLTFVTIGAPVRWGSLFVVPILAGGAGHNASAPYRHGLHALGAIDRRHACVVSAVGGMY